jgi:hypothetical protein
MNIQIWRDICNLKWDGIAFLERLYEETDEWERFGSIDIWELIPWREISWHAISGWCKKNDIREEDLVEE